MLILEQFRAKHVEEDPSGLMLLVAVRVGHADLFDPLGTGNWQRTRRSRPDERVSRRGEAFFSERDVVVLAGFANQIAHNTPAGLLKSDCVGSSVYPDQEPVWQEPVGAQKHREVISRRITQCVHAFSPVRPQSRVITGLHVSLRRLFATPVRNLR